MSKDGGPAFPQAIKLGEVAEATGGMSLRDWFAGQALSGMEVHPDARHHPTANDEAFSNEMARIYARSAYRIADAMLAARTATGGENDG